MRREELNAILDLLEEARGQCGFDQDLHRRIGITLAYWGRNLDPTPSQPEKTPQNAPESHVEGDSRRVRGLSSEDLMQDMKAWLTGQEGLVDRSRR